MEVERLIVLVLSASKQLEDIQIEDKRDGYALAVKFLDKRKADIAKGWREVANGAGLDVAGHGAGQIGNSRPLGWMSRSGPRAPSSARRRSAYRPEPTRKSRRSPRIEPR